MVVGGGAIVASRGGGRDEEALRSRPTARRSGVTSKLPLPLFQRWERIQLSERLPRHELQMKVSLHSFIIIIFILSSEKEKNKTTKKPRLFTYFPPVECC